MLVRQAIDNMLRNAIQHDLAGGGRIEVRIWTDDVHSYISVSNTGAQISPDLIDSLREPFVRGIGRTARRGTVTGWAWPLSTPSLMPTRAA